MFSEALSGSMTVCPGALDGGICVSAPGSYDYTRHAYDALGDLVDVRTLTLVVG